MMPAVTPELSPLRNSTQATGSSDLAAEQARHFGIDPDSEYGRALVRLAVNMYESHASVTELSRITMASLQELDRTDRIAWFNAKRFVSFQLAKVLDTLQNPLRATYQSMVSRDGQCAPKGAYSLFDNVTALFSANPVITRTATYMYACTEWIESAFSGREPLHHIYSRLLNPTSISLANHIVDVECGRLASQYMAWNFNSGLAAIDAVLSHVLGHRDILVVSRNIYGGTYQLLHDWYAKRSNMDVAIEWVDGYGEREFVLALSGAEAKHAERLREGRRIYVFLESPCNPHGFVLDVPGICRASHERGSQVIADTTVGTPFLCPVLRREDPIERPDFVVHSYTKDLAGSGTTTAGCVIGRNEDMFLPKGSRAETTRADGSPRTVNWDETLFWNVYYVKGAFLDADKAFEVLNGMKTLELRLIQKAVNTIVIARVLDAHPYFNVTCPALQTSPNHAMCNEHMFLGLPAGLFTFDLDGHPDGKKISERTFKRFFDLLEPAVGMQVTLGQNNTVALCPALTSHSELSEVALADAGIKKTTTRVAVGLEDPRAFLAQLRGAARIAICPDHPEFLGGFLKGDEIDRLYAQTYLDVHARYVHSMPSFQALCE
jgi:O-acetylhomoserine/O-acetylserine sulfhydrylase-like pyridoxal-dependent enzyme